jgi:hypothetical protein
MDWRSGGGIDEGDTSCAHDVGQAGCFSAAKDFPIAINNVGASVGIAETGPLIDGELGEERSDVSLAVAVGHSRELRQGAESYGQDAGVALVWFAGAIHGVIDGLFGERMTVLDSNCLADPNPAAPYIIKCTWFRRI